MTNIAIADLDTYGNWLAYYSKDDGTTKTEYFCTPNQPWLSITQKWWKVMKMTTVLSSWEMTQGKTIQRAWWSPDFSFSADNLVYVEWLSYS